MPKAGAQRSRDASLFQLLAQVSPVLAVRGSQVAGCRSLHAGRVSGDQPDRATQNRTG